jgi:hypothetical protein
MLIYYWEQEGFACRKPGPCSERMAIAEKNGSVMGSLVLCWSRKPPFGTIAMLESWRELPAFRTTPGLPG